MRMPISKPLGSLATELPSLRAWHIRRLHDAAASKLSSRRGKTSDGSRHPRRQCSVNLAVASQESTTSDAWSFYDYPELYEAAFGFRDFDSEVKFLEEVFEDNTASQAKSFLELGCGAANHGIRLAKRGHKVYALDISSRQIAYAKKKAEAANATVRFLREDMCAFELPGDDTVDVATILLGTLSHLQTNEEVLSCWEATLAALKPGGILVIELLHPSDIFDGTFIQGELWEADYAGGKVVVEFGTDDDQFDSRSQVLSKRIGVSVRREDDIQLLGEAIEQLRIFTFQELLLLSDLAGFAVVGAYGDFDLEIDMEHQNAARLLICLQKPWDEMTEVATDESLTD